MYVGVHHVSHVANACLGFMFYSWAPKLASFRVGLAGEKASLSPSGPSHCPILTGRGPGPQEVNVTLLKTSP